MSWYHISPVAGLRKLEPRELWVDGEGVERVSASSSIQGCFRGLRGHKRDEEFSVYRIDQRPDLDTEEVMAQGVEDADETGEVWYLGSVRAEEIARGDRYELWRYAERIEWGQVPDWLLPLEESVGMAAVPQFIGPFKGRKKLIRRDLREPAARRKRRSYGR